MRINVAEDAAIMTYIHEQKGWPSFRWNDDILGKRLTEVRHRQGRLLGKMEGLGFPLRDEAVLQTLTEDVLKSWEIEGELLDKEQVRSSIAQRLGIEIAGLTASDRHVDGVVEMMLDATQRYSDTLTSERLFGWHAALFPTGHSGISPIVTGGWRQDPRGPMQVVSGPIGREKVHYQAPAADRVGGEMQAFLDWFETERDMDHVLKAGIAHFWFVTIHPFDDGNGRIARAIADMALARSERDRRRFYSMSAQIRAERDRYYEALETSQKGDVDITAWLIWFLDCLDRAFDRSETILASVLRKARFWDACSGTALNDRQRRVVNRLLEDFEGNLTTSKWARLTRTSQDTALRDVADLVHKGLLERQAKGGRSTSYALVEPPADSAGEPHRAPPSSRFR